MISETWNFYRWFLFLLVHLAVGRITFSEEKHSGFEIGYALRLVLHLIGRLFVIGFALLIALFAGSLFIGFGLASGMFPELMNTDGQSVFGDPEADRAVLASLTFVIGLIASFQLAGLALLPVTIAIAVTELMKWQAMTVHLVLGGICALFTMYSVLSLPTGSLPANGTVIVSLATGFIAAFFYWLIAGRTSGNWLAALGEEDAHSES